MCKISMLWVVVCDGLWVWLGVYAMDVYLVLGLLDCCNTLWFVLGLNEFTL